MRGLKGKVAIVTGGLGDLGYASAKRLVEEGCSVAIFDFKDNDDDMAQKIGAAYCRVDITKEKQVADACEAVKQQFGLVTVLVHCAVHFRFKSIDATLEDWQKITAVNLAGTTLVTNHAVAQMREAGGGSIIIFSSVSGFIGQPNFATYNATKFALRGLARCWAQDLAPDIRVNTLCPGYIYTSAFVDSCNALGYDVDEEDRKASELHLLGRQGRPEEIAGGVAFLASDDASFMTGSDLIIDGGYLAK